MKLNCKPGDLAVIVRDADFPENVGHYVEIQHAAPAAPCQVPGFNWRCGPLGPVARGMYDSARRRVIPAPLTQNKLSVVDIPDADLRPIRDPGEDARDETLEWLPVPTPETA